jgi:hypothetical protein
LQVWPWLDVAVAIPRAFTAEMEMDRRDAGRVNERLREQQHG